jgi:hypothetical protein
MVKTRAVESDSRWADQGPNTTGVKRRERRGRGEDDEEGAVLGLLSVMLEEWNTERGKRDGMWRGEGDG